VIAPEKGNLIYLNTNPLVHAVERDPAGAEPMRALLRALRERRGVAVTSELTLGEIMVRPVKLGNHKLKRAYLELLVWSKVIELVPISRQILYDSADYRAVAHPNAPDAKQDRRNFFPDAIHVMTAAARRCRYFVSRDDRIKLPLDMALVLPEHESVKGLIEALS
jgi:predicted nucleic acid-binding protein